MAWARVDDQWFAHRKVVTLTLAARGLWTTVLSWSCAQRSDHVPTHMARFLAGGDDIDDLSQELVDAGLWIEADDGWYIHDWSEYQDKSLSEKRSEAGAKGGKASGEARREANGKQTKQPDEANDEAGALPGPTRPGPSQEDPPSTDVDPEDRFGEFWNAWPARNGKKLNKPKARQQWRSKVKPDERDAAIRGAHHYRQAYEADLPGVGAMDAFRWLRDRSWPDWQEPATPPARRGKRDGPAPPAGPDADYLDGLYPPGDPRAKERTA